MPFEDFVVCDADMHVMEPADLWQRYMTPEYRHAAPVGMTELKRDIRVKVKSQVLLRAGPVRPLKERGGSGIGWRPDQEAAYGEAEARGWDAQAQLDAMDREGVDLTVLFPTRGLFTLGLDVLARRHRGAAPQQQCEGDRIRGAVSHAQILAACRRPAYR